MGYPTSRTFLTKNVIFHISPKFELIAQKIGGRYPLTYGRQPPWKFFLHSRLGLAKCFHSHFAMVGLCRFRALPLELAEYDFFLRRHCSCIKVSQWIGNVGMRNCWEWLFGGRGGGTPPPEIFLTKNVIFHTNQLNSSSYDRKIWGVGTGTG